MDQQRVRKLFTLLPPGAAYPPAPLRSPFRPTQADPAERFAFALHDPAFGSNFVEAHLKQRRWLPDTINAWPLLQFHAARWLRVMDPLMMEVGSFRTEARRQERDLLEALLLARSLALEAIARHLNVSEEVVEAYETLFWNVRDRLDERGYVNALLYPAGVQAAVRDAQPDAEGDRLRLLRAGAQDDVVEVLALAGYRPRTNTGGQDGAAAEVGRRLQQDAVRRLQAGCRVEDGVVRAAHAADLRRQEARQEEDSMALHHINAVTPALEELRMHNSLKSVPPPDFRVAAAEIRERAALMLKAHQQG